MSGEETPIADEPNVEELLSVEDFRRRTKGRFGVIVIDDKARGGPIAHDRECPFVTEDNFVEKVIEMGGRQGRYYWAKNSGIAIAQLGARRCRHPGDRLSRS